MDRAHSWKKYPVVLFLAFVAGLSGICASDGIAAEKKKGAPMAASIQDNMAVEFEYTLTVDDKVVDSSNGQSPMSYVHGKGQIIPGLEREMAGMRVGDSKEVTVKPQDGYGEVNPAAVIEVPRTQLPQGTQPEVGMILNGRDPDGHTFQARVSQIKEKTVLLDMNHPLAGKTLHFKIKVVEIAA